MSHLIRLALIAFALVSLFLFSGIDAASVLASGVVGTGAPASCTQNAFNAKFNGGGTVTFNCGNSPVTITLTTLHTVNANTTIDGGKKITLAASNVGLFQVAAGRTLTLKNITLSNGKALNGGAVENLGTLTLTNVKLNSNQATSSGGAIENQGTLTITNSQFTSNHAVNGGAIASENAGTATLNRVTFTQNNGADGGALYLATGATVNVTNSTFSGNTASYGAGAENNGTLVIKTTLMDANIAANDGGGVWNLSGDLTLEDTTLSRNTAGTTGGGLSNYGTQATLRRVSLIHNQSSTTGGGMYNEGTANFENVTFGENTADGDGGGYYNALGTGNFNFVTIADNLGNLGSGIYRNGGTVNLKNTLLSENTNYNCHGTVVSQGHNLSTDAYCVGLNQGTDKPNTPQGLTNLGPFGGYTPTYELSLDMNALNAGVSTVTPSTDQRGLPRLAGVAPDIGSVERCQEPPSKVTNPVPAKGASVKAGRVSIAWTSPGCNILFHFELRQGSKHGPTIESHLIFAPPPYLTTKLAKGTYYWQIETSNETSASVKSAWFTFTTK